MISIRAEIDKLVREYERERERIESEKQPVIYSCQDGGCGCCDYCRDFDRKARRGSYGPSRP